ncbi:MULTISPECIES: potassium channel family protein [unclassified Peribacillus]|jgi:potassium channel LctB|uniref:potassium channel family protein n=1 Tax=unclassified Peribacillus TaxID=2675266 RepID=UPI001E317428|nr:potassium channel family protein [Peribacillus sp. Bi96]
MTFYILIAGIIFCMVMSIRTLFLVESGGKKFSLEDLLWLGNLYATILVGFALIYLLYELQNHSVILDMGNRLDGTFYEQLKTSFYFSAMTMFSVGYGDIAPIGMGRMIATIQAFIGYTLPAAFVIRTVIDLDQKDRKDK